MSDGPAPSRGWLWHKTNALVRYASVHGASGLWRQYVVNEFPRSGGTWLAQMLGAALHVPFPRNEIPRPGSAVMHGHHRSAWGVRRAVLVVRDPRDVAVSAYFYYLFEGDRGNAGLVARTRRTCAFDDLDDIQTNLAPFTADLFSGRLHPGFPLRDLVREWTRRVPVVRYEDLHADPATEVRRAAEHLSGRSVTDDALEEAVARFTFKEQAGRAAGEERSDSFLRKGVVGDWRTRFDRRAADALIATAGDVLIELGYEPDHSWADALS